ncbi:formin-1-like [Uloborus diversus]|uniref:formin-1-like n=1 Tax=Uloborus diversus TaxID=327109 RepID=UPI002409A558|nr:formin-1-like [Uloborus diversus]
MTKILSSSDDEQKSLLQDMMDTFLPKALADTRLQMDNLEHCKKRFRNTQKFFRFQPKSNNESEWPKEFFSLWMPFCSDFKDIWKKEQQRKIQENIAKLRKRVNDIREEKKANIVVAKTKPNGLKARLSKMRNNMMNVS